MVFDGMQPSDCEHDDPLRRYARRRDGPACLNPHPANGDFRGVGVGIMGEYVSPIKLRNCYAEIAILKLRIEIGGMQQQIGAMQRHAEIDSQQPGRHPGCKVPMMNMDVSDASPLKAQRVIRSQPRVEYGAKPPERRFSSLNQHT